MWYISDMQVQTSPLPSRILAQVDAQPGAVWTPVDFLNLGPRTAVDKALQRMAAAGDLRRIARGLYDKPAMGNLTGKPRVAASSAVIDAIARRDQIRVLVDGITAANDLGLTTAVPARVSVLTDARLRPIRLGNQDIRFAQAAPSRLYWAGRPAMRVVQALYWIHDVLTSDRDAVLRSLQPVVKDPKHGQAIRDDLLQGMHTLPIWMQALVHDLIQAPGGRRRRSSHSSQPAGTPRS
jgi:hypothetical protein